jgi:hypothetical protein
MSSELGPMKQRPIIEQGRAGDDANSILAVSTLVVNL